MEKSRDVRVVDHIIDYCERIDGYINADNIDYDAFRNNDMLTDAVCMCVLQIGELSSVLSENFKEQYSDIQWRQIEQVRNIIAHHYGTVDKEILWEIVKNDIPELQDKCVLISAASEAECD